jgi:hypothetical protein
MRADNHQLLQPLCVDLHRQRQVRRREDRPRFKTDVKVDGKDTAMPTPCQMQRPNG